MESLSQFIQSLRPILEPLMIFGMIVIIMLLRHQQRMARIVRGDGQTGASNQEVERLRYELEVLKAQVNQQTLLMDSIVSQQREIASSSRTGAEIERRVSVNDAGTAV